MGALAVAVLVNWRDADGWVTQVLLGSGFAQSLSTVARPEHMATLLSQLSHQLWWCRRRANLQPVRVCLDASVPPLVEAIRSGDLSAAQRAARIASVQPQHFWPHIVRVVEDGLDFDDLGWARCLRIVVSVGNRCRGALPPDDAAALATVLAGLVYQRHKNPIVAAS